MTNIKQLSEKMAEDFSNNSKKITDIKCPHNIKNAGIYFGFIKGFQSCLDLLAKQSGEYWQGEIDKGIVGTNYFEGKIKVIDHAALLSANAKTAKLEEENSDLKMELEGTKLSEKWAIKTVNEHIKTIAELQQRVKELTALHEIELERAKKAESENVVLNLKLHQAESLIERINNHCLCERNSYGFDYHEKHRKLGPPESGKRWLTPVDMIKTYLQNKGG